jgi:hypothetical protein
MHVVYASLPFSRKLTLLRTLLELCCHQNAADLAARPYIKELFYLVAFEEEELKVPRDIQEVIVIAAADLVTGEDW